MNTSQRVCSAVRHLKVIPLYWWSSGINRWQRIPGRLLAASLLACAACSGSASAKPPLWWCDPKTEDCENLYFTASAETCPTEQEARDAALLSAKKEIASQLALKGGYSNTTLPVNEVVHPTEQGPKGWSCWVMVKFSKAIYQHQIAIRPPPGPRQKILVAPFAFDAFSRKDFAEVIDRYQKKGYGLGLWETVYEALEDSPDFEPDTLPPEVADEITAGTNAATVVTGDTAEYLLIPNANFFVYADEQVRLISVISNLHYHASIRLALYRRESGHWVPVASALNEKVDTDLFEATNTGARQATQKLLDRWHARQPSLSLDQ